MQYIVNQYIAFICCAQNKTRTCTGIIPHKALNLACLPIPPPGHFYSKLNPLSICQKNVSAKL